MTGPHHSGLLTPVHLTPIQRIGEQHNKSEDYIDAEKLISENGGFEE